MKSELQYKRMRRVSYEEYKQFIKSRDSVIIEDAQVKLQKEWNIKRYQPDNYIPEEWTVWSFPDRGDWATHVGNYRGNWSPYVPRNLIERYTKPGDLVCDPMMGSGTTLVECKLTGRNAIGVDINPDAVMVAMNRLDFKYETLDHSYKEPKIELFVGDARNLDAIEDNQVDLIATHPPYCSIIPYTKSKIEGDISSLSIEGFMEAMSEIAKEFYRILKDGGHCAILIGDTRKHKHYVPIHVGVLEKFLNAGFVLREDIIKLQHKTKITRERWRGHEYDFYKIAHEHLYVFRKLAKDEKLSDYKYSTKWW
ncbi:MAG: DNA methyltransferase [Conexivisphaerales archaeon]